MCFNSSSSLVETLTDIDGVPLSVIKCDSTWRKAFGADLVGFYVEANYYYFILFFLMLVISVQPQLQYIEQVL